MSDFSPSVSVIISFFNEEIFLAQAIESVLQQDYTNWQLILVDDGSTDESKTIAKAYAERFSDKIIYCEHPNHENRGLSASRNLGIQSSNGVLIALLDADDIWLAQKLSKQTQVFIENPEIGLLIEASLYWYSWVNKSANDTMIHIGAPANIVYPPKRLSHILYPLGLGAAPCPSGWMMTKQAWHEVDGFEESFTGLYEDQAFLSKVYLKKSVYVSADCSNLYRQRTGSMMDSAIKKGQYNAVRKYFLTWFSSYLSRNNILDQDLNAAVRKLLRVYQYPALYRLTRFSPLNFIRRLAGKFKTSIM